MKLKLAKSLIVSIVLGTLSIGQAKASITINCKDDDHSNGFTILIPENTNEGDALVVMSSGQKLNGVFKKQIINAHTRLAGATQYKIVASYQLPDYNKPHDISVSIVGYNGDLGGFAELTNLTGTLVDQIIVSCNEEF